jgi:UDPglucose 6-dehydrogenase
MKIMVVGSAYVWLLASAWLAELGNNVLCLNVDSRKINILQQGVVPIYEHVLEKLINNVAAGRLRFTTGIIKALHTDWCR